MPERDWERLGDVPEGGKIGAVVASPEGFGLIGTVTEPSAGSLLEKMKSRRARLLRVAEGAVTVAWEGPGWIQALDAHGQVAAAIVATLKPSGSGSDYFLLVSTDGGREWNTRGPVGAPSLAQVRIVTERELGVLGAWFLGVTQDGGASWSEVELDGERNPNTERLRRVDGGLALLGKGLTLQPQSAPRTSLAEAGATRLVDADGAHVVAVVDGQTRVGERQDGGVRWLEPLPAGREPLRLVSGEGLLRLLTRGADPSKGADPMVHTSEDGGATWTHQALPLGAHVDIAGREWGLGVHASGTVYGRLA